MLRNLIIAIACFAASPAVSEAPVIVDVQATHSGMGWRFDVTLSHPDSGWDHYADGWEVLDEQGNRLGYRKLLHPHVEEQPFTRSLSSVMVPDGVRRVYIRARCSRDLWSDVKIAVELSP